MLILNNIFFSDERFDFIKFFPFSRSQVTIKPLHCAVTLWFSSYLASGYTFAL